MPVYHSTLNDLDVRTVGNISILPLKTRVKGPAPLCEDGKDDIIDEAIKFFRANVLFSSFEVKGNADRVLIFLTLYISQVLKRLERTKSKQEGSKIMHQLAVESFPLPGEQGWHLGGHIAAAKSSSERETMRSYFKQLREETGLRMLEKVFGEDGTPNKWWLQFCKRKFMNITVR